MATYTSNYQLHQWVPEDDFLRSDFNEDFQKIDAGIAAALAAAGEKTEIVAGSYTGNDAAGRTIDLGFQPKAVFFEHSRGVRDQTTTQGGLALQGMNLFGRNGGTAASITPTGFSISYASGNIYLNASNFLYYYLAIR